MQRVAIVATASGCGKTTVGRSLAAILGAPFVELDAIHWQAGWRELDADDLRRRVAPLVARDSWVIDGSYRGKLGDLVLEAADTVVWLDLPRRIWLPRLVVRTLRRVILREVLWNGNRESLWNTLVGFDSLFRYALGVAMVVFYVVLTPIWLGLRGAAWVAELRSRLRAERRNASTSAGERRRATR